MLNNHLKIAFRQIKKQKFYSAINILGLAIGVTCCLLITLFIQDEMSYDQSHPDVENLYRVVRDHNTESGQAMVTVTPPRLARHLLDEIPEVTNTVRLNPYFFNAGNNLVRKVDVKENVYEEGFIYADPSMLEMFNFPLIKGDPKKALEQPNTIVISKRIAEKYFGTQSPVGETFILNDRADNQTYTITGVMENMKTQNHFQYDFLMSMSTLSDSHDNPTWLSNSYYTYITLADGTDPTTLDKKLQDFVIKNMGPAYKESSGIDIAEMHKTGHHIKMFLQPVTDIHLHSEGIQIQLQANGDIQYVRLFGIIALFILIIALMNFVNLSTSRSANRAKEVGLRKVLGSYKKQLITQFLSESVLQSFIAFGIGGLFTILLLQNFNSFAEKELAIPFSNPVFIFSFLGAAFLVGILAGLYPAFYLSKFQPVKVLKGKLSLGAKSGWLRSSLVVIQFAISIGLIVGTLVVKNQMDFIQNKNMGFDREQVLLVENTYLLRDQLPEFKEAIKNLPEVKNASVTGSIPVDGGNRSQSMFHPVGKSAVADQVSFQTWSVDEDYVSTMGMTLIEGRTFQQDLASDTTCVIINTTAARELNILKNPIGQQIKNMNQNDDVESYKVIGVVEDFHFASLKGEVQAVGLFFYENNNLMSVKSTATEMSNLIAKTEAVWKSFVPTHPFRYAFMDERFEKMYIAENRMGQLFSIFSMLAIFIACLGLLALATFMTEQKIKEIGIRKVLGASVPNIVFQLSKSFLTYVVIGLLIAIPIAWFQMNKWLESFAYRIEVEWWMFALAGILAITIAFITVGSQTLKAALNNPMEALRSE